MRSMSFYILIRKWCIVAEYQLNDQIGVFDDLMIWDIFFKFGTQNYIVGLLTPIDFRLLVHVLSEIQTWELVCVLMYAIYWVYISLESGRCGILSIYFVGTGN